MTIAIFFIFGLMIGSFLNVVVFRLRLAESFFWTRSKCPHCQSLIRWFDNIPLLSFFVLGARCRDCRKKISWQYPLVELATGIVFGAIGANFFVSSEWLSWVLTGYYCLIFSALVAILVYDWLYFEILGILLWGSVFLAIIFNLFWDWQNFSFGQNIWDSFIYAGVLAGTVGFSLFFFLVAISREKWMGMGDANLAILLGLFLGWPKIILAFFLAFALGAIYGIILIVLKKKKMKSQIPFAPFLVAGTLISFFFFSSVSAWYWSLLF
ncbi:MAG: hypothetical protein COZ85_00310 [Candidatus Moranbacteria bacterium CG_4_8_14_3_um_filter_34_16]|nr:MAG: hypothetical protein COT31_02585 [Candidatus Moranbacteria bacterium CG08_land_8_20_14_0_20_34_16]PIW95361.1 MAG: hypothetical protein COZ85_00310 [Candidatus Moranbacteria bacterium CG_4_8_14_3_um_filter_34_16]